MRDQIKGWTQQLNSPAESFSVRHVKELTTALHTRDDKAQLNAKNFTEGVMIEAMVDGFFAYAATNTLSKTSLQHTLDRATERARQLCRWNVHTLSPSVRPGAAGRFSFPSRWDTVSVQELSDLLIETHKYLKAGERIITTSANAQIVEIESNIFDQKGSDLQQIFHITNTDYSATAQEGSLTQTRFDNGWSARCYQSGAEVFQRDEVFARAQMIGLEALALLSAPECPSDTRDLVLDPDQMLLQIHESIGHPLEIDRILGDERNYAGSSFVKLSDFGRLQYGSPLLNITFDPTVSGEIASYAYDDGRLKAERQFLIKDGVLLRGLGGSESQTRSGVPGVASFRASSWNRAPIDRMANLNLEPGDNSFNDIIAQTERGIYMKSNRSWSIDDYRNKFQFGCEYGQLIENGQLTTVVRNPNYRGISAQFWKNLDRVGSRDTFSIYGTPVCGKGEPNQAMRVGHGAPVCRFRDVEIFGGG